MARKYGYEEMWYICDITNINTLGNLQAKSKNLKQSNDQGIHSCIALSVLMLLPHHAINWGEADRAPH